MSASLGTLATVSNNSPLAGKYFATPLLQFMSLPIVSSSPAGQLRADFSDTEKIFGASRHCCIQLDSLLAWIAGNICRPLPFSTGIICLFYRYELFFSQGRAIVIYPCKRHKGIRVVQNISEFIYRVISICEVWLSKKCLRKNKRRYRNTLQNQNTKMDEYLCEVQKQHLEWTKHMLVVGDTAHALFKA